MNLCLLALFVINVLLACVNAMAGNVAIVLLNLFAAGMCAFSLSK